MSRNAYILLIQSPGGAGKLVAPFCKPPGVGAGDVIEVDGHSLRIEAIDPHPYFRGVVRVSAPRPRS